ncbi:MAG: DUF929 family protein [Candidatus Micrarchaeia archaeon]
MPNENAVKKTLRITDLLLSVAVVVLAVSVLLLSLEYYSLSGKYQSLSAPSNATISSRANSTPPSSNSSFGSTLKGIDTPFNSTELSIINNAPDSYFEKAGEMLLNSTLNDQVVFSRVPNNTKFNAFYVNGKPSVIYIGAISCIFCGENKWAMALALSRFGSFSKLYKGYSSFGDGDIPTIYWIADNYTTPAGVGYGNYYSSNYINFISSDYESPIKQGFQIQPLSYFISKSPNATYTKAISFMNSTNLFQGTPFTFWGNIIVGGADAVVFGNSTPSSTTLPLTYMTHSQVLSQLKNFNDQFSWGEYAGADIYISYVCPTINNSAPVCSLPAIKAIEKVEGLA